MLIYVNPIIRKLLTCLALFSFVCWSYAASNRFPTTVDVQRSTSVDPPSYSFTYEEVDRMLQLIETYRNFRPSNAFLDYGVAFFPEKDPNAGGLRLVAKACVILPQEAVPLNLPGNSFPGELKGETFFDDGFLATFKQDPKLANGAPQAYTFTALLESQVQLLLSRSGTVGIKAFQVKVDYGTQVSPATTSVFYNLNVVNDIAGLEFGQGAVFVLGVPCPPFWRE